MLFGNYSENNLNVFDLDLIWNGFDIYENVWLNILKCISIFELNLISLICKHDRNYLIHGIVH